MHTDPNFRIDPNLVGKIVRWRMGRGGYYQKGMIRLHALRHVRGNVFHAQMRVLTESKFAERPLEYMDKHIGLDIFSPGLQPHSGHLKSHLHSRK